MDLAKVVSTIKQYTFNEGSYSLEKGEFNPLDAKFKVVVYDYDKCQTWAYFFLTRFEYF
jgi:carbamoyl-phosphate synthase small subunit